MVPYEWIDKVPDALVEMYAEAESAILCDMADRISHMSFYGSAVQFQEQMLQEMGLQHDYIVSALSDMTGKTTAELETLISEAGAEVLRTNAYLADVGYNLQSVAASDMWKARLAEGLKKTGKLFENLTSTTASVGANQFRNACDMAYMQVESGAFSPTEAIANAVRRLSRDGIETVEYYGSSGITRRDKIDVAVRRAVVTGINQTTASLQLAINEELGLDLVEVSAHEGARPEHAAWQGGIYSLSGTSRKYPDFRRSTGYGTGAGLCGWNCRHTFAPYVDGSPTVWSKGELDKLNSRTVTYNGEEISYYEATQKQRYIERSVRRWKREVLACDSADVPIGRAAERLAYWNRVQNDFTNQTGFKKRFDSTSIIGYNKVISDNARQAAAKYIHDRYKGYLGTFKMTETVRKLRTIEDTGNMWVLNGFMRAVNKGDISVLIGYDYYAETARAVQKELVGLTTVNGTTIKGFKTHLLDRIIGQVAEDKAGKRKGVPVEDVKDALLHGTVGKISTRNGKTSVKIIGSRCDVVFNLTTGNLIQTNPR